MTFLGVHFIVWLLLVAPTIFVAIAGYMSYRRPGECGFKTSTDNYNLEYYPTKALLFLTHKTTGEVREYFIFDEGNIKPFEVSNDCADALTIRGKIWRIDEYFADKNVQPVKTTLALA